MKHKQDSKLFDKEYVAQFGRYLGDQPVEFPDNEILIGREKERASMMQLLFNRGEKGVYLVSGYRGAGKTRFVQTCIEEYIDNVYERFLRGSEGRTLIWDKVVAAILLFLGILGLLMISQFASNFFFSAYQSENLKFSYQWLLILPLILFCFYPFLIAKKSIDAALYSINSILNINESQHSKNYEKKFDELLKKWLSWLLGSKFLLSIFSFLIIFVYLVVINYFPGFGSPAISMAILVFVISYFSLISVFSRGRWILILFFITTMIGVVFVYYSGYFNIVSIIEKAYAQSTIFKENPKFNQEKTAEILLYLLLLGAFGLVFLQSVFSIYRSHKDHKNYNAKKKGDALRFIAFKSVNGSEILLLSLFAILLIILFNITDLYNKAAFVFNAIFVILTLLAILLILDQWKPKEKSTRVSVLETFNRKHLLLFFKGFFFVLIAMHLIYGFIRFIPNKLPTPDICDNANYNHEYLKNENLRFPQTINCSLQEKLDRAKEDENGPIFSIFAPKYILNKPFNEKIVNKINDYNKYNHQKCRRTDLISELEESFKSIKKTKTGNQIDDNIQDPYLVVTNDELVFEKVFKEYTNCIDEDIKRLIITSTLINRKEEFYWLVLVFVIIFAITYLENEWILKSASKARLQYTLPSIESYHMEKTEFGSLDSIKKMQEQTIFWLLFKNWLPVNWITINLGFDQLEYKRVVEAMLIGLRSQYYNALINWHSGFSGGVRIIKFLLLFMFSILVAHHFFKLEPVNFSEEEYKSAMTFINNKINNEKHKRNYSSNVQPTWGLISECEIIFEETNNRQYEQVQDLNIFKDYIQDCYVQGVHKAIDQGNLCTNLIYAQPKHPLLNEYTGLADISLFSVNTTLLPQLCFLGDDELVSWFYWDVYALKTEGVINHGATQNLLEILVPYEVDKGIEIRAYHLITFLIINLLINLFLKRWNLLPFRSIHQRIIRLHDSIAAKVHIETETDTFSLDNLVRFRGIGGRRHRETEPIDPRAIEMEFMSIIDDINNPHNGLPGVFKGRLHLPAPRIIFMFDELDKIGSRVAPLDDSSFHGLSNFQSIDVERRRALAINTLLAEMKNLLAGANAKFIFVGGRNLYDEWLADRTARRPLLTSIFQEAIYLPSFLVDHETPNTAGFEERIRRYLFVQYNRARHLYYKWWTDYYVPVWLLETENRLQPAYHKRPEKDDRRSAILTGFRVFPDTKVEKRWPFLIQDRETGKVPVWTESFLNEFIEFLTFRSMGNAKTLKETLESFIKPAGSLIDLHKKSQHFDCEHVLRFSNNQRYRIQLISSLYRKISTSFEKRILYRDDKMATGLFYIADFLSKFHRRAFSWSSLERLDELIHIHRAPDLRVVIEEIVLDWSETYLHRIRNGLYDFRFRSDVSKEFQYSSRQSDVELAAINFTLDESQGLKLLYQAQLKTMEGEQVYEQESTLAELHEFDEEYEYARYYYRRAIAELDSKFTNRFDREGSVNSIGDLPIMHEGELSKRQGRDNPEHAIDWNAINDTLHTRILGAHPPTLEKMWPYLTWGITRLRLMLLIGMTYERSDDYERAGIKYHDSYMLSQSIIISLLDKVGRETAWELLDLPYTKFYSKAAINQDSSPERYGLHILKDLNILFQPMFALAWISEKLAGGIDTGPAQIESRIWKLRSLLPFVRETKIMPVSHMGERRHANFALTFAELHNKAGDMYFIKGKQVLDKIDVEHLDAWSQYCAATAMLVNKFNTEKNNDAFKTELLDIIKSNVRKKIMRLAPYLIKYLSNLKKYYQKEIAKMNNNFQEVLISDNKEKKHNLEVNNKKIEKLQKIYSKFEETIKLYIKIYKDWVNKNRQKPNSIINPKQYFCLLCDFIDEVFQNIDIWINGQASFLLYFLLNNDNIDRNLTIDGSRISLKAKMHDERKIDISFDTKNANLKKESLIDKIVILEKWISGKLFSTLNEQLEKIKDETFLYIKNHDPNGMMALWRENKVWWKINQILVDVTVEGLDGYRSSNSKPADEKIEGNEQSKRVSNLNDEDIDQLHEKQKMIFLRQQTVGQLNSALLHAVVSLHEIRKYNKYRRESSAVKRTIKMMNRNIEGPTMAPRQRAEFVSRALAGSLDDLAETIFARVSIVGLFKPRPSHVTFIQEYFDADSVKPQINEIRKLVEEWCESDSVSPSSWRPIIISLGRETYQLGTLLEWFGIWHSDKLGKDVNDNWDSQKEVKNVRDLVEHGTINSDYQRLLMALIFMLVAAEILGEAGYQEEAADTYMQVAQMVEHQLWWLLGVIQFNRVIKNENRKFHDKTVKEHLKEIKGKLTWIDCYRKLTEEYEKNYQQLNNLTNSLIVLSVHALKSASNTYQHIHYKNRYSGYILGRSIPPELLTTACAIGLAASQFQDQPEKSEANQKEIKQIIKLVNLWAGSKSYQVFSERISKKELLFKDKMDKSYFRLINTETKKIHEEMFKRNNKVLMSNNALNQLVKIFTDLKETWIQLWKKPYSSKEELAQKIMNIYKNSNYSNESMDEVNIIKSMDPVEFNEFEYLYRNFKGLLLSSEDQFTDNERLDRYREKFTKFAVSYKKTIDEEFQYRTCNIWFKRMIIDVFRRHSYPIRNRLNALKVLIEDTILREGDDLFLDRSYYKLIDDDINDEIAEFNKINWDSAFKHNNLDKYNSFLNLFKYIKKTAIRSYFHYNLTITSFSKMQTVPFFRCMKKNLETLYYKKYFFHSSENGLNDFENNIKKLYQIKPLHQKS